MIIGGGMLAKEFIKYDKDEQTIIFASGVSNSNETSIKEFDREKNILVGTIKEFENKKIIYFSTCSMYDTYFGYNAYTQHKLNMEEIIRDLCHSYIIFRLPQVLGMNNKHQLIGFLQDKITNNKIFNLYDIERNIIDNSDIRKIVFYILKHNLFKDQIVNIANPNNIRVLELVRIFEQIYNVEAKYEIIDKPGNFRIDTSQIDLIIEELNLFEYNYIENRIRKYYG